MYIEKKNQIAIFLNSFLIYSKRYYKNNLSYNNTCSDHYANLGLSQKILSNVNVKCYYKHFRSYLNCIQIELLKKEFEIET